VIVIFEALFLCWRNLLVNGWIFALIPYWRLSDGVLGHKQGVQRKASLGCLRIHWSIIGFGSRARMQISISESSPVLLLFVRWTDTRDPQ
jgi:hypothetical protein